MSKIGFKNTEQKKYKNIRNFDVALLYLALKMIGLTNFYETVDISNLKLNIGAHH